MIIKFVKLSDFTGYFVFLIDWKYVFSTSMPDDDFYKRMGWDKSEVGKSFIQINADKEAENIYNI